MGFVTRGWKGDERLWKVTWLGYLGGAFILVLLLFLLEATLGEPATYVLAPLVLMINVWGLVAMWRCAKNVDWNGWFYLARVAVAFTVVGWALDLAGLLD